VASSKRDEPPRSYPVTYVAPRIAAESLRVAGTQPIHRAVFSVRGAAEAILEPGHVRVRLGRLFSRAEAEEEVRRALERSVASSPS
jgi:hypothetical protein